MNKLFLINGSYYVLAFDYYDAITIFEKYMDTYDENIIRTIEMVNDEVICKQTLITSENNEGEDEEDD